MQGLTAIAALLIALTISGDSSNFVPQAHAEPELQPADVPDAFLPIPEATTPAATALGMTTGLMGALTSVAEHVNRVREPETPVEPMSAWITHYGERFNDRTLGCYGYGPYSTDDPTIVAVNPTMYESLPCGTLLELCGPGGCLVAARKDSCPGCRPDGFDLSEAAFREVCGDADGVCTASVEVLKTCQVRKFGEPPDVAAQLEAEEMAQTGRIPCHPEFLRANT